METRIGAAGPQWHPYFHRTAAGAKIDLLLVGGGRPRVAVEVKHSTSAAGFHRAADDLGIDRRYLVYPPRATPTFVRTEPQ